MNKNGKSKREALKEGLKNPDGLVVILVMIVIVTVLTWIIPSGAFDWGVDEATGRTVVIDGSFHLVEDINLDIFDMLKCIPKGIEESAGIIAFIFIISGAIQILRGTGALDAGIHALIRKLAHRDTLFLIIISVAFSLLGATIGFSEETIPFIPIGVSIAVALGYDRVVGFHIVRTAAWVGFAGAFLNPFTVGVAQGMAEVPLFSGWGYRLFCYGVFMGIGMIFIIRYAKRIKQNPASSILHGYHSERDFSLPEVQSFTLRQKLALLVFVLNMVVMFYGVNRFGWYTTELAALFFGFGVVEGAIGGLNPNQIAKEFVEGMKAVTFGALIVGFARTLVVIMESACILDTVVYGLSQPVSAFGSTIAAVVMFLVQSLINFFIGSGSGQAAAVMPIMVPLSDVLHITRQTSVLAYQFGDGITNMLWPTMIYYLAFADIPYSRWVKHIAWLVLALSAAACVLVAGASIIQYGPY